MGGALRFRTQAVSNQVSTPSLQSAQILPKTQSSNQFENTTYLMRLTARGPENERTILITMDGSGETLKLADIDLSEAGSKTLHSFEFPSPVRFAPPFYILGDYIIAPVTGADANDILIFTLQGAPISLGVRQNNTELANWLVFYDEWVKENVVKVKLFGVDNSTGTAQIDLTTGQIVPGSYLELGKFQESNN